MIVSDEKNYGKLPVLQGAVAPTINFEAVVIGALEQSFLEMVMFLFRLFPIFPHRGTTRPDKASFIK